MKVIKLHQQLNTLIDLAIAKDRKAQQEIYGRFAPKMLSVCRLYIKDLQHAEDVMLTGFMKVFSNIKNFEDKGSFEGWMRRIMVNECLDRIRTNKKIHFIDDELEIQDGVGEIDCNLGIEEIQTAIDNLPEGYKMIFNLYAIEGYKHKEIAEMLGINEGTSKSQLSNARKMLQVQINKLNEYQKWN
ncbi:RNA polymerase sigma factor [Flavobacterium ardleyense]|uniref:RNA polymerase sigma factor n=1 Tax=Flavobacterium ardleyense TaxID=2038737 RepID=UPI00298C99C5|nr:RNA polymerase sigma factor [Flavobacterium ardleyense]